MADRSGPNEQLCSFGGRVPHLSDRVKAGWFSTDKLGPVLVDPCDWVGILVRLRLAKRLSMASSRRPAWFFGVTC